MCVCVCVEGQQRTQLKKMNCKQQDVKQKWTIPIFPIFTFGPDSSVCTQVHFFSHLRVEFDSIWFNFESNCGCIVPNVQTGDKLKETEKGKRDKCRSGGSVMLWGAFCWHVLGPLVPLEGRATANQYKVVLSDHLYPMMKHFYPDGSGLFQDDDAPTYKAWGVTGLMSMKMNETWIICYGLRSHQISTQSNTYGRFWTDVLDSHHLHHHHQNRGNIFGKNGVHPSSSPETWRINAKVHWSCSGSTWWPNTLLRHFMLVFPLICHLSTHKQCMFCKH